MTKEEALKDIDELNTKLEELKKFIEDCDNQVGFEDDEIFLLSAEEYEQHKSNMPKSTEYCWWLRSEGFSTQRAAYVSCLYGAVNLNGEYVNGSNLCVRPALKISGIESETLEIGKRFNKYCFPWIYLGDGIAIAETPVTIRRFDYKSNDYQKSQIRKFLLYWLEERKDD